MLQLGGKFKTEFLAVRPKTYSYWADDHQKFKKLKEQKNVNKNNTQI